MKKKFLLALIPGIIFTVICVLLLALGTYLIVSANMQEKAENVGEAVGVVIAVTLLYSLGVYAYIGAAISAIIGIPLIIDGCVLYKKAKKEYEDKIRTEQV